MLRPTLLFCIRSDSVEIKSLLRSSLEGCTSCANIDCETSKANITSMPCFLMGFPAVIPYWGWANNSMVKVIAKRWSNNLTTIRKVEIPGASRKNKTRFPHNAWRL